MARLKSRQLKAGFLHACSDNSRYAAESSKTSYRQPSSTAQNSQHSSKYRTDSASKSSSSLRSVRCRTVHAARNTTRTRYVRRRGNQWLGPTAHSTHCCQSLTRSAKPWSIWHNYSRALESPFIARWSSSRTRGQDVELTVNKLLWSTLVGVGTLFSTVGDWRSQPLQPRQQVKQCDFIRHRRSVTNCSATAAHAARSSVHSPQPNNSDKPATDAHQLLPPTTFYTSIPPSRAVIISEVFVNDNHNEKANENITAH